MAELLVQEILDLGLEFHRAGRLGEAGGLYRQILAADGGQADALHLLGVIAQQEGRLGEALALMERAIEVRAVFPECHTNLGNVLLACGRVEEAVAAQRMAAEQGPDCAGAFCNLGNALRAWGEMGEAIEAYRRAIELQGDFPEAFNNLGNALRDGGRLGEAAVAFRRAIELRPGYGEAYNNLGNVLRDGGEIEEAIGAYGRAIEICPTLAEAYGNLGVALMNAGRVEEAEGALGRAIGIRPDFAEAFGNLGNLLRGVGRVDEAVAALRRAVALRPDFAVGFSNLGSALKDRGEVEGAMGACRRAMELAPGFAEAHSNLLVAMEYCPGMEAGEIAAELGRWDQRHARPLRGLTKVGGGGAGGGRIRVGYVSPDFRDHVVGRNVLPLLRGHDREAFEITCYGEVMRPDWMTGEIRKQVDRWRSIVGMSDEGVAEMIRGDGIEVLVDLTLHLGGNRLLVFARRPARVQGSFAGYPGSTGLSAMDFRLSDPYLDPAGVAETACRERTIRLADSFWCYDPLECGDLKVNTLPALGARGVTFGCLNQFCKVNDEALGVWGKVMGRVKGSRLVLMAPDGECRGRVLARLGEAGVEGGRVEFVGHQARRAYLETYHRIDLGLDTFPYNGHTTSLDALWMGVPVVTVVGGRAVGRAGLSQLSNLGMAELAGRTREEMVEIAVGLAGDLERLAGIREGLRGRMEGSVLMDGRRFAKNVEKGYREAILMG